MESWRIEKVCSEKKMERSARSVSERKRFVLHRHSDEGGVHLDLRLEEKDVLVGWRLPCDAMEQVARGEGIACELKLIHPKLWLEVDYETCAVEDSGTYSWVKRDADGGTALFEGKRLTGRYEFARWKEPAEPVPASYLNALSVVKDELGLNLARADDVARLLARACDGDTARTRAVERLCALGMELDAESFDEGMWRKTLRYLSLAEIHAHLRTFERRFDEKYPPVSATRPEKLEQRDKQREKAAVGILSEEFSLLE